MKKIRITIEEQIAAKPSYVWECYTAPEHITNWNFADISWHCPSAQNDLRIGGTYLARMEAKDGSFGFDFEAVYTALEIGHSFTYEFGGREAQVAFTPIESGTHIQIEFDAEDQNPVDLQRSGWQSILRNFKQYVETSEAV